MKIAGYTITDTLFRTDRVTIHVAVRDRDGADVAIKTLAGAHPTRAQIDELRREFQLTLRLAGIPRVIRIDELVTFDGGNVGIVMEYFGVPLRRLIRDHGRPSLGRTLDLAIGLAQTLGAIHEMGIVHKDVTPNNILVSPDLDDIRLIDFGIASELASEQPSNAMVAELAGSFAYMSPEQSGRMNRRLDYRSDFYSLGVTLFEVLTGTLPFDADHALGWIQCHVAQPAPAASERDRSVPTPVSAIVQKLMAKNAEDRYQSAFGLIADLERCRDQLDQTGVIAGFDIGRQDLSRTFDIPQRLFGRDAPRSELLGVFDLVASGSTELLLVAGESGVGKTALVSELAGQLVRRDGHMVSGKFDQLRRNTAYAAMIDALHEFVQQLLTEPDEALATWRRRLLEALGTNGQLIVDVVPDIERIIGPQAPVAELPPTEALNRFRLVFANLLRAAAQREHPLVIFLDDLQWSDGPTLELLELLVTRDIQHLLVIGAYRDNEVDSGACCRWPSTRSGRYVTSTYSISNRSRWAPSPNSSLRHSIVRTCWPHRWRSSCTRPPRGTRSSPTSSCGASTPMVSCASTPSGGRGRGTSPRSDAPVSRPMSPSSSPPACGDCPSRASGRWSTQRASATPSTCTPWP
jgi:hypothetical protein